MRRRRQVIKVLHILLVCRIISIDLVLVLISLCVFLLEHLGSALRQSALKFHVVFTGSCSSVKVFIVSLKLSVWVWLNSKELV